MSGKFMTIDDGVLEHTLLVTQSTQRKELRAEEEMSWYNNYVATLERFKPDIVYYYGGQPFDYLIADEARHRGIATAFYLANGNYQGERWKRDIDLVITDTQATASLYERQAGIAPIPMGKFVDPATVVATEHQRTHLLFVNPTFEKGGAIVARLAILLAKKRPDIILEIVESRGNWQLMLEHAFRLHKEEPYPLANVVLTPNQEDMRQVYGRARLLIAPSLWWESGARVIVEALLNGIPCIVTSTGGSPELMRQGGIQLNLSAELHRRPYQGLPTDDGLSAIIEQIMNLYDDEETYQSLCEKARFVARCEHDVGSNSQKLVAALTSMLREKRTKLNADIQRHE